MVLVVQCMTLNIFKFDLFFIVLEYILNLRASLHFYLFIFVEIHQFNVILSCFKQNLDNYVFNVATCTLLAPSSKICRFFFFFLVNINCLAM